mgnify:CR=1 FL=1
MDNYIGEIRLFAGRNAPENWAFCDGRLLALTGNEALFSLIGTTYGGDGTSTFALPDMRGRIAVGQGRNPQTATAFLIGQKAGAETVTLDESTVPHHGHAFMASNAPATALAANGNVYGTVADDESGTAPYALYAPVGQGYDADFASQALASAGTSVAHDNAMPTIAVNFIIALEGLYPQHG